MNEIENLLQKYHNWLKDKTAWKQLDEWVEITTPYIDRHNDYIQIYLRKTGDTYLLTDDEYTLNDLEQNGCALNSSKRQELLQVILNGFGVIKEGNALQITANRDNFALRKHNLLQSILAVNDMFYLAQSHTANFFYEDVEKWLEDNNISFVPNISFIGHSGYNYQFDFVIPKSGKAPERMISLINNPVKNSSQSIILSWLETRDTRPKNARAYAFVNDNAQKVAGNALEALRNYNIYPVLWSQREEIRDELAA